MASTLSSLLHPLTNLTPILLPTLLILYLALCQTLRFRRARNITSSHPANERMTTLTAWSIHNTLITLEFPSTFSIATTFALFKAYGIPSISSLLVSTQQLAGSPLASSKRYADTGALLLEAVLNEPGSKRSVEAWGRVNWLHDRHRGKGSGKGITDEDMLYTLSLFALEPMRWVKKYEWRELSPVEVCAVGTMWKYYGQCLKVPLGPLSRYERGWHDGRDWMQDLESWSEEYEKIHMVPAESNGKLAEATLKIVLYQMPKRLHGFGKSLFASVMEEKLRRAMLIETPPSIYTTTLSLLIELRKFYLRYLSLPRYRSRSRLLTRSSANDGRINLPRGRKYPWYIRPTFKKRWGPLALLTRLRGGVLPGDDAAFMPEGFLSRELGPMGLKGKGQEEVEEEVRRLGREGGGGCPFVTL